MALLVESPVVVGTTNVFEEGKLSVESITVNESSSSSPPKPLLIVTPTLEGTYPVLLFFHGFLIQNKSYKDTLQHISSHGFIVVAAQEVDSATEVTNWLSAGLQSTLPKNVQGNLLKLALSDHSRGGKAAFALALGHAETQPTLKFSALIGLDPVAGSSIKDQIDPKILTFVPRSFDLSIPIAVIGTGKSSACAPDREPL
ncbi:Chlorophyllase-1 [Camellia lanceoleosa]|uniref:Chlorophyllase-1 n=1 Tax=Camellia lanceoleosa TaxID=1840588 RepID=A0ACC0H7K4_9ERIC|nr:Chlorophyllase-1 [Camellia lanceoleosa]